MTVLRGAPLWRAWFGWVSAGELAGFAAPATVGALVVSAPPLAQVPALLAAGALEGGILGLAQAHVLRRALPSASASRWVAATVFGAMVAWLAGMTPAYAWPVVERLPLPVVGLAGLLLATILLLSIGIAQWYVLRDLLPHAGWWVAATAVAWLAGLAAFTAVSTPLWQPGQRWPVVVLIGVLAGAVMAATMAAVTGAAVVRLTATVPVSRV